MGTQLALIGAQLARPLEAQFLEALEAAWLRVLQPHAETTLDSYRTHWRRWLVFCRELGRDALPIEPKDLIAYLTLLSTTHAPNTVRVALAALASADQLSRITPTDREPHSIAESPVVKRWLKSWSREHPRAPKRRAAVVRPRELRAILDAAREPASRQSRVSHLQRYARDRAIWTLGVTTGLRVSNLALLDAADIVSSERGLQLHIRRSKTDQEGRGRTVAVLPQSNPLLCPIDAWRCWLVYRGALDGPAFCPIDRQGTVQHAQRLTTRSIQRMISERAARAGVALVTSHSMRRSMATIATEQGKRAHAVMRQGGWKSFDSLACYIADAEAWEDNPTSGLLDE
jgi:integrase